MPGAAAESTQHVRRAEPALMASELALAQRGVELGAHAKSDIAARHAGLAFSALVALQRPQQLLVDLG